MKIAEPGLTPAVEAGGGGPGYPDSATYRSGHLGVILDLEAPAASDAVGTLGGVVVPAFRPFSRQPGLELAARLARHHECALVVLCSGLARAAEFPEELRAEFGDRLVVTDLPRGGPVRLSSLRDPLCRLFRSNDAAAKRNLGIAIAVRMGWPSLLFLDDDVSVAEDGATLDEDGLAGALARLESTPGLRAVSWTVESFPDNSVVGHARRLVEIEQHIFVGSAALLVRCDPDLPFFPGVYNEDWMFLIALAQASDRHRECIARVGKVRQLPYEPFSPARAMSEEPGDIIAEGLMNLLEDDGPGLWAIATTPAYWRRAMARRAGLLEELVRVCEARPDVAEHRRARTALRAALRIHRRINPEALRNYVCGWRADLRTWRQLLGELASRDRGDLATALAELQPDAQVGRAKAGPGR